MSVHQPYSPQFNHFRAFYNASPGLLPVSPNRPAVISARVASPMSVAWPARDQNGTPVFYGYSGYLYYLSPYQHPVVVQQASTAAGNWFLDAVGKMPWRDIVPSWVEVTRMGVRSAQDQLAARLSKWRRKQSEAPPLRSVAGRVKQGIGHWV